MKISATGAAGFIGYHLAKVANSGCKANFPRKKLLENGHEVIGYDNINDYYDVNLNLEDTEAINHIFKVGNLAAQAGVQ